MIILGIDPGKTTGVALYDTVAEEFVAFTQVELSQVDGRYQFLPRDAYFLLRNAMEVTNMLVIEETIATGQRLGIGKAEQIVADVLIRYVTPTQIPIQVVKPEVGMHPSLRKHPALRAVKGGHARAAARLALYAAQSKFVGALMPEADSDAGSDSPTG